MRKPRLRFGYPRPCFEDITSDLSKISNLFVIARNSAFIYKGKAVKVQEVSKELGVRYVLEGSVRKVGDQVRITTQLVDGTTGGHLWSERYDRPLTDIFNSTRPRGGGPVRDGGIYEEEP